MNNLPREKLKYILTTYGRSISEDPKRCEALLRDFCGQYRKEINVLVSAIREGIPSELSNSQNKVLSSDLLIAQLTKRLENYLGLSQEAARWGVESWEFALDLNLQKASTVSNDLQAEENKKRELEGKKNQRKIDRNKRKIELETKRKIIDEKNRREIEAEKLARARVEQLERENQEIELAMKRLKEANQNIERASATGCIWSLVLFCVGLYQTFLLSASGGMPIWWIYVFSIFGLSVGVSAKSRICAVIMLIHSVIFSCFVIFGPLRVSTPELIRNIVVLIWCIGTFIEGVRGTFEYHKQIKSSSS